MAGGAVSIAKRALRLMLAVTMMQMVTQAASPADAETLIVQGSTTFNRRIMEPFHSQIEAAAGHGLTIIPNKSTPGLIGLMEGRAHLSMISAPLRTEIDILRQVTPGTAYERLREFNISTMTDMPASNRLVAGSWFADRPGAPAEASVEGGIAKTLHLKLGDSMRFDIAGQIVEARITSLRKLEWGSMKVNFFVIINPAAMRETPQTWITAFHLDPRQAGLANALTRDFPNLTVIDVGGLLRQIQAVLDQVVTAVEFLFAFTLVSGLLVLYAALMGSQDERTREAALLRALGATRRQLAQAQLVEFLLVGALAGLLAATGAAALGWALATYQFKFDWSFHAGVWLAGLAAGTLCAIGGGYLGLRTVLRQPPLQTLREA